MYGAYLVPAASPKVSRWVGFEPTLLVTNDNGPSGAHPILMYEA